MTPTMKVKVENTRILIDVFPISESSNEYSIVNFFKYSSTKISTRCHPYFLSQNAEPSIARWPGIGLLTAFISKGIEKSTKETNGFVSCIYNTVFVIVI